MPARADEILLEAHEDRIRGLEGSVQSLSAEILPTLRAIEGKLDRVVADVEELRTVPARLAALEKSEADRADRRKVIWKTVLGVIGTVLAAAVLAMLGFRR